MDISRLEALILAWQTCSLKQSFPRQPTGLKARKRNALRCMPSRFGMVCDAELLKHLLTDVCTNTILPSFVIM